MIALPARRPSAALLCVIAASLALFTGCGEADKHASEDTATSGLAQDATATTADVVATDVALPVPKFVAKCTVDTGCSASMTCVDGVCVPKPSADHPLVLSDPDNDNLAAAEPANLGCIDQSLADQIKDLPGAASVTIWGRVDRFGAGPVTADVEVAVFRMTDFHPEACAGIADVDAAATCMADDAKVGKPLAKVVSVDPDAAVALGWSPAGGGKTGDSCSKHLDCRNGYECRTDKAAGGKTCMKMHGVYAIEGVPTNTSLVLRVRKTKASSDWHDSYLWDYVLFSNRTDVHGAATQPAKYLGTTTYRVNPTIVGQGQWELVPQTMGFTDIAEGNGVIGGRIRDCGVANGRGGWAIHNARVGVGTPGQGVAYFNKEEDSPIPDKLASATDVVGRYAAVDLPPGPNRIAAAGYVDGKVVSLGSANVWVVPNALIIVSLPGRVPVLNK